MTKEPIDPLSDPVLIGALSDRLLAQRVLDHSRKVAAGLGIDWTETSPRATMLNSFVPALAHALGADVSSTELLVSASLPGATPDARVATSVAVILDAVRSADAKTRDPLFADPAEGNLVAMMVDRYAARHEVPRTRDADGWTKPRQTGLTTLTGLRSCVSGGDAIGQDPLATHMIEATAAAGRHAVPYWSPGHTVQGGRKGRLGGVMTPESILRLDAEDAVAARLHALPPEIRAGEVLVHARDMRDRHALGGGTGRHSFVLDHAVPAMAAMHGHRLFPGEGEHFRDTPPADDQDAVGTLSTAIMKGIVEGKSHIIDLPMRRGPEVEITLGDRILMRDAAAGNSAAMLLDGVAEMLGADRGGRSDPLAESISKARRQPNWSPQPDRAPSPVTHVVPNARAIAMARAASMGRGR